MTGAVPRFSILLAAGVLLLGLRTPAAEGQTLPLAREIAAGVQYGLQDPERPATPGWLVSGGFDLGASVFVVESGWHRNDYVREHPWDLETGEVLRKAHQARYWTLTAGVRSGPSQGRVAPYYQVLAGVFSIRFRTDNEWPASIDTEKANAECGGYVGDTLITPCVNVPYPAFEETHRVGFVMQPGLGLDVNVSQRLVLRLAADLPIFAAGESETDRRVYRSAVGLGPARLSARVVVKF